MMTRHPDGTWRNNRKPKVLSPKILRARWVDAEVLRSKTMGLSFEEMAEHITRVGRGKATAMVAVPPDVTFPDAYSIRRQACHKAFERTVARQPTLERDAYRKLDNARSEEMFLNLQPRIRKGDPRAIEVGVKVLHHSAKINGYAEAQRRDERTLADESDERLSIVTIRNILADRGATDATTPPRRLLTGKNNRPSSRESLHKCFGSGINS
jgi:hypothetical protein